MKVDRRDFMGISALAAAAGAALGPVLAGCQGSTNSRVLSIKERKYDPWRRTTPDSRFVVVYKNGGIHFVDFQLTDCSSVDNAGFELWFPDGRSALIRVDGNNEVTLARYDLLKRTQEVIARAPATQKVFGDSPSEPSGRFIRYEVSDGNGNSTSFVRDRSSSLDIKLGESTRPGVPGKVGSYVGSARYNAAETAFVFVKEELDASGQRIDQGILAYDGNTGLVRRVTESGMEGYDEVFISPDIVVFNEQDGKGNLSRVVTANVRDGARKVLSEKGGNEYHIMDEVAQDEPGKAFVLARRFEAGVSSVVRHDLAKGTREYFVPVGNDCAVARSN
jgi:hypothetical protein